MRQNRFQDRSGVTERRSLAFLSLCSPHPRWGLFKLQHLSHFTTQLVEKPLVWRPRRSTEQHSETASRHLRVLSRAILCICLPIYLSPIFYNWSQVCLHDHYENIYTKKAHKKTIAQPSSEDNMYNDINCCRCSEKQEFPGVTVRHSFLNSADKLFHSFIYVAFTHGTKSTRQGPNRKRRVVLQHRAAM